MSDRRLAAVILVATGALAGAAVPSTAHAGGGGAFLPPMRVDVGPSVSSIEDAPAGQVVAGIHWASVYPKGKAGFDVGIGIVSTFRGTDDDATATARVTDPMAEADDPLGVFGGYVEVAAPLGQPPAFTKRGSATGDAIRASVRAEGLLE